MIVDENLQYSVAKRGSVAGLPYQPATNDLLCFFVSNKMISHMSSIGSP